MEEEDETHSLQSPGDSLSPQQAAPPIVPTSDVTVASVTKPSPLTSQSPSLALVVHTPSGGITGSSRNGRSGGGGGGGGGRDDCWSEEATRVLIDAWGDRFSEPGKGTLKQQQWKEVAEIVNESRQCKYPKTDIQCKNRIDTVKKKYKQEKAKVASGDGPSKWVFFKKLETLIGGGNNNNSTMAKSSDKAPMGVLMSSRSSQYRRQAKGPQVLQHRGSDSMRWHFRKRSASETESESEPEPEPSPDSAESLPPSQPLQPISFQLPKRLKVDKSGGSGVGEVAKAILGFTEAYEKAETAKLKLMFELEKERMKFAKEMELQRMQFLKTQMEVTQNNQEDEEEEEGRSKRGERRVLDGGDGEDDDDDDDDRNVKNNGDVSS